VSSDYRGGFEAITVEEAGDQIIASNQRQVTHGRDDVSGGAIALATPALRQSDFAVNAT
jgi:hypothetical protein